MDSFYKRPSLITEVREDQRVGIVNEEPQSTLDVGGDMNVRRDVFVESNLSARSVEAASNSSALVLHARSNLMWGGHSLYDPYPGDENDWDDLIPFRGDEQGLIHQSWIRKPLTAKDILTDLWNIGEGVVDLAEVIKC
jgi:hypothetical protein